MTDKLAKKLPDMYAELHARGAFKGDSWRPHLDRFHAFLGSASPVLDFGCGPKGGLAGDVQAHYEAVGYDPYVPYYADKPWARRFKAFFSCDVFEHLTLDYLHRLFGRLRDTQPELAKVFVALSTRPANKTLSNGLNVHLIVKPGAWWLGFMQAALGRDFAVVEAAEDLGRGEAVFAFARPNPGVPTVDVFKVREAMEAEE